MDNDNCRTVGKKTAHSQIKISAGNRDTGHRTGIIDNVGKITDLNRSFACQTMCPGPAKNKGSTNKDSVHPNTIILITS